MKVWILNAKPLNANVLVFREYKKAIKTFNNFLLDEIMYELQYNYTTLIEALDRWHKYKNTGRLPMFMEIIETDLI